MHAAALLERKEFAAAAAACRELLREDENDAEAWSMLGVALRAQGRPEEALPCAQRAAELSPENFVYLTNYGNVLAERDDPEAVEVQRGAFRLAPGNLAVRENLAVALRDFGHLHEAQEHFDALRAQKPGDADSDWNRAENLLRLGRLREGWAGFEARWQRGNKMIPSYAAPRWRGEDFSGKTLLVYEEQGYGDTILSCRYLRLAKARGGRVLFGCRPALHRLFEGLAGADRIVGAGALGETFHYHIPSMSLPGIFGTDLDSIPPVPELHLPPVPPAIAEKLAEAKGRFKVGIVWSGNPEFKGNRRRSASLERFLPLSEIAGVQLFSLQKNSAEDGLIPALGPYLDDFADTAAVVGNLDLVIMTDSAVAHLAGSIGKPVWNLLAFSAYWLYLARRDDSPWYPSMRLIRQDRPGDWDGVFAKAAERLAAAASAALR